MYDSYWMTIKVKLTFLINLHAGKGPVYLMNSVKIKTNLNFPAPAMAINDGNSFGSDRFQHFFSSYHLFGI